MSSSQAVMIMLDNSEYSVNGDYPPSRWEGQIDVASLLIPARFELSQMTTVGLGLMGGKNVEILCSPTSDQNKPPAYLFGIKQGGQLRLAKALNVAALALKNRQNDTQKQRIIAFVGSSISDSEEELAQLGKKLKKYQVHVDLIVFGDLSETQKRKVNALHSNVAMEMYSRVVYVEKGKNICDHLTSTNLFNSTYGEIEVGAAGQFNAGQEEDFGDDPELAMALRISREEEAARLLKIQQEQEKQRAASQQAQPSTGPQVVPDLIKPTAAPVSIPVQQPAAATTVPIQHKQPAPVKPQPVPSSKMEEEQQPLLEEQDEDAEAQRRAIELSLQEENMSFTNRGEKDEKDEKKKKDEADRQTMVSENYQTIRGGDFNTIRGGEYNTIRDYGTIKAGTISHGIEDLLTEKRNPGTVRAGKGEFLNEFEKMDEEQDEEDEEKKKLNKKNENSGGDKK